MTRLGVFLLPPGWDASPSQGYPQHWICRYPFIHLGGERHRESKVSCPRTLNRMSLARTWTWTTRSGVKCTQGRSQYEASRGTCLGHFLYFFFFFLMKRDFGVIFKCIHHKHLKYLRREFNHGHCLSHNFFLPPALALTTKPPQREGIYMRLGRTQTGMNLHRYEIFATVYMKPGRDVWWLISGLNDMFCLINIWLTQKTYRIDISEPGLRFVLINMRGGTNSDR